MNDNYFLSIIESQGIAALAGRTFSCPCGKVHTIGTKKLMIGEGILKDVISESPEGTPFIIADQNTWPLAPSSWEDYPHYIFTHDPIEADEYTIGDLLIESQTRTFDYMIALGSGNIGDSVRYVASALNKPMVNVTTAPSMDGACSRHSPLIHHKFKTTYTAHEPYAVFFDLSVMEKAPKEMIAAGLADVLGKYNATLDWYLGHLATGEDYCPYIRDLTMEAVRRSVKAAPGLALEEGTVDHWKAVREVAEALMISSLAMQLNVTSRPASGLEHLISHSWENYGIEKGISPHLHGDKVGIGTLMACDLYRVFFLDAEISCEVLARLKQPGKNPAISHENILKHWDELKERAEELYEKKDEIRDLILTAGGPVKPWELGISPEQVRYGFEHMTDGRPRVTLAHLIEDLSLEDRIYEKVIEQYI